jgi:hypothetical protein
VEIRMALGIKIAVDLFSMSSISAKAITNYGSINIKSKA